MCGSAECFRSTRFSPFSAYLPFNKRMILEWRKPVKRTLKTKELAAEFDGRFWNDSVYLESKLPNYFRVTYL